MSRTWTLTGADGQTYESPAPGPLGGHGERLACAAVNQLDERG
jgi:hypothetical protein